MVNSKSGTPPNGSTAGRPIDRSLRRRLWKDGEKQKEYGRDGKACQRTGRGVVLEEGVVVAEARTDRRCGSGRYLDEGQRSTWAEVLATCPMQCPSGGIMRGLQKSSQRLKGICSAGGLRVPTRNQAIKTGGGKAWNMIESINSISPRPLNGTAMFRVWAFLCFFF